MGVFSVPVQLRNWQNQFLLPEEQGKDVACDAMVDCGAVDLALPVEIIEQLRLKHMDTTRVYTADNTERDMRAFGIVECEVQGRTCRVQALELPRGSEPLLGAVPLEEMDWHVSPREQKLVPNPRSPDGPLLPLAKLA